MPEDFDPSVDDPNLSTEIYREDGIIYNNDEEDAAASAAAAVAYDETLEPADQFSANVQTPTPLTNNVPADEIGSTFRNEM